jgi:ubiquitin C-terminal hydrolase
MFGSLDPQQDAHEFYHTFVDALHLHCFKAPDTLHLPIPKGQHSAGVCAPTSDSSSVPTRSTDVPCDCVVHSIFGGVQLSQLSCKNCGVQSKSYERFFDISLHIGDQDSSTQAPATVASESSKQAPTAVAPDVDHPKDSPTRAQDHHAAQHDESSPPAEPMQPGCASDPTIETQHTEPQREVGGDDEAALRVREALSLPDLIKRYVATEDLIGLERVACSNCSSHEEASRHLSFEVLPPVMCFQLKRFRFQASAGKYIKDNTPVDFPVRGLDLSPWTSARCPVGGNHTCAQVGGNASCECFVYDLTAVVHHSGTMESGHYMVYTKQDGVWFLCEDERVSRVSEEAVTACQAYLLVYAARMNHTD